MDTVVQWATILSPIIAVLIAWWTVRSSSKDTAKKITVLDETTREQISALEKSTSEQIAALEENTTKQVESIKLLARNQMNASIKQIELEIEKNLFLAKQAWQEWEGIQGIKNGGLAYNSEWKNMAMKEFQEKKPSRDYHLYNEFIKDLENIKHGLEINKNNI